MDPDKTMTLISLVQELSLIWKKDSKDFLQRDKRRKAYEELARETGFTRCLNLVLVNYFIYLTTKADHDNK